MVYYNIIHAKQSLGRANLFSCDNLFCDKLFQTDIK